jgi:hypothetical protein
VMKSPTSVRAVLLATLLVASVGCSKQITTTAPGVRNDSAISQTARATQPAPFAKSANSADDPTTAISSLVPAQQLVIPSGTAITVRLQNSVSSSTSSPGDQFDAVLDQPIILDGQTVAPTGAQVQGRVVAARRSGRLMHPGYLRIALSSMTVNGKTLVVQSSSVMVAGASHRKRNLAWIGGGAGGGALIGALATGGSGALIGSAIGAAGGTTTAYVTGKKDVGFGPERRLTFRLTRPVNIV